MKNFNSWLNEVGPTAPLPAGMQPAGQHLNTQYTPQLLPEIIQWLELIADNTRRGQGAFTTPQYTYNILMNLVSGIKQGKIPRLF